MHLQKLLYYFYLFKFYLYMLVCENRNVKKDTQAIGYDRTNWHLHRPGNDQLYNLLWN